MLLTLLILAPVASEWIEISQQYYLKPVKVTSNPSQIDTVDKVIKRKGYEQLNTVGKLSESTVRPNRVYINHTIAHKNWDDVFNGAISDKPVIENNAAKLNTKLINRLAGHENVPFKSDLRNEVKSIDKNHVKVIKLEESKRVNGNKLGVLKDSKTKPLKSEKPNRIYIGDEYSGSLEVLEWADLDRLAEKDSEESLKNRITPEFKLHLKTQQEAPPQETNTPDRQEKNTESYQIITKQPLKHSDTDTTEESSVKKTEHPTEKSVTIIQKHMIAKITKVKDPNKPKISAEEYGNEEQNDHRRASENTKNITINKFSDHKINELKHRASSVKNISTSVKRKPIEVMKNRYENRVYVKSDKVPDPEEIMIQELLEENNESNGIDISVVNDMEDAMIKDGVSKELMKHSEAGEVKTQVETEKGTKAPDPDEVMIKEILNEEINKSSFKIPKFPANKGSVSKLQTSTVRITTNKKLLDKQSSIKKTDYSTEKPTPDTKSNVGKNNQKFDKTGLAPTVAHSYDSNENQATLEKVSAITTVKPKPSEIQQEIVNLDSEPNEFDDRDFEKLVGPTTTEIKSYEATTTEESSTEVGTKESFYKSKVLVRDPTPEFVSKEEFFTESEELLKSNIKDDSYSSTIESVSISSNDFTSDIKHNVSASEAINSSEKSHKTLGPDKGTLDEDAVNENNRKENTMNNVVKLLKVVTDIIARNTKRSVDSKVRYLEDLKDTLLANIQDRLEAAFPASGRRTRSLPATAPRDQRSSPAPAPRGHVDFPSSESALMTISFLTFAVFLIKLVLQVIHSYKSKSALPTVVAAVGRAGLWPQHH